MRRITDGVRINFKCCQAVPFTAPHQVTVCTCLVNILSGEATASHGRGLPIQKGVSVAEREGRKNEQSSESWTYIKDFEFYLLSRESWLSRIVWAELYFYVVNLAVAWKTRCSRLGQEAGKPHKHRVRDSEAPDVGERSSQNPWLSTLTVHHSHLGRFSQNMGDRGPCPTILIQLDQGRFLATWLLTPPRWGCCAERIEICSSSITYWACAGLFPCKNSRNPLWDICCFMSNLQMGKQAKRS